MATTQQPSVTPQMTFYAGGNRNAMNKPVNAKGEREWSHGLLDCFDNCGTCIIAWFLPCVIWGQNKSRLDHLERSGTPHPGGGEAFSGDCALHCLLTCCSCGWVLQIGTRGSMRNRYRIEGSGCGDCMSAWCCTPCELTQESREIRLEEQSIGSLKA